jgi:tetratricopeptide (TPR) repeat protein
MSYRAVPAPARRLFRLLGLIPGADICEDAALALLGGGPDAGWDAIDRLCTANLLTQTGPDRFALHDLLRVYAAERAAAEDPAGELAAARERLYSWYDGAARRAADAVHPERVRLPRPEAIEAWAPAPARAWLAAEQANLLAIALRPDAGATATRIVDSLRAWCAQSVPTVQWRAAAQAALAAAADDVSQASAHLSLAEIARRVGAYSAAIGHYETASAASHRAGWVAGRAAALGNLGTICRYAGRVGEAVAHFASSAQLNEQAGRVSGLAAALGGLGIALREQGDLPGSVDRLRQALELYREAGSPAGTAAALENLGEALHALRRPAEALPSFREALALFRSLGDEPDQALALCGLAGVHAQAGRVRLATAQVRHALAIGLDVADLRERLDLLLAAGSVHAGLGERETARAHYEDALSLARTSGNRYPHALALTALAELTGSPETAAEAAGLADESGYDLLRQRASAVLTGQREPRTPKGIAS